LFSHICPGIWPPKGSRACPANSRNHCFRTNLSGVSRFGYFVFLILCFCGFMFVFAHLPWHLATQGHRAAPRTAPDCPKSSQNPSKLPQATLGAREMIHRCAQTGPTAPRESKEVPKGAPNGPHEALRPPEELPKSTREAYKRSSSLLCLSLSLSLSLSFLSSSLLSPPLLFSSLLVSPRLFPSLLSSSPLISSSPSATRGHGPADCA
jgi:hypothetical protein